MNNAFLVRTSGENNIESWCRRQWFSRYKDKKPVIADGIEYAMMFAYPEKAVEVAANCNEVTGMQFEVVSLNDIADENQKMMAIIANRLDDTGPESGC